MPLDFRPHSAFDLVFQLPKLSLLEEEQLAAISHPGSQFLGCQHSQAAGKADDLFLHWLCPSRASLVQSWRTLLPNWQNSIQCPGGGCLLLLPCAMLCADIHCQELCTGTHARKSDTSCSTVQMLMAAQGIHLHLSMLRFVVYSIHSTHDNTHGNICYKKHDMV